MQRRARKWEGKQRSFAHLGVGVAAFVHLLVLARPSLAVVTLTDLGSLGGTVAQPTAISADGSVVIGTSTFAGNGSGGGFRWTRAGGMQLLPDFGLGMNPLAVSSNGSVSVGTALLPGSTTHRRAVRLTSAGVQDLGTLGGTDSDGGAMSGDGSILFGSSYLQPGNGLVHGFRWTASTGMQDIGTAGGASVQFRGASPNGLIAVGTGPGSSIPGAASRAFRWTAAGGFQLLPTLGGTTSDANAISADSLVIVGTSTRANISGSRAFRWSAVTGIVDLGTLGGADSSALAVNMDGSAIVGSANAPNGGGFITGGACMWRTDLGTVSVYDYLTAQGLNMAGWSLNTLTGVSADGSVVCGYGNYNLARRAFIIEGLPPIPAPTTGSLLVPILFAWSRRSRRGS